MFQNLTTNTVRPPDEFYQTIKRFIRISQTKLNSIRFTSPITPDEAWDKIDAYRARGKNLLLFKLVDLSTGFEELTVGEKRSIASRIGSTAKSILSSMGFKILEHDRYLYMTFEREGDPKFTGTVFMDEYPNTIFFKYDTGIEDTPDVKSVTSDLAQPVLENYYPYEMSHLGKQFVNDFERLMMNEALMESVSEIDYTELIMEDAAAIKSSLISTLEKLIEAITNLSLKFQNTVRSLVTKNEKWIATVREEISADTVSDNYSFEIYPYWKNMNVLLNFRTVEFNESNTQFLESLSDANTFRETYFKTFFIMKDGKSTYDPKNYLRGDVNKVKMTKTMLLSQFDHMLTFLSDYMKNTKSIVDRSNKIVETLRGAISKIRSAPIQESDQFTENILRLLEADEPATSDNVDKEDGREGERDKAENGVKDIALRRKTYSKICYEINSARMMIIEEAYDSYIKAILSARKKAKK